MDTKNYDLNSIWLFLKIVENGSISSTAQTLRIPKSTVSTKLKELESQLGIVLLKRTSRSLVLTKAGESYYKSCMDVFARLKKAHEDVKQEHSAPSGTVRLTAPFDVSGSPLLPKISQINKKYPLILLEFVFSDEPIHLLNEKIDIALRGGDALAPAGYKSEDFESPGFFLVASPEYLKQAPPLLTPKDLKLHSCICHSKIFDKHWALSSAGGKTQKIELGVRLRANSMLALREMAADGLGVTFLPATLYPRQWSERKKLVRVLPEWKIKRNKIKLIYSNETNLSLHVSIVIDHIRAMMKAITK